MKVKQSQSTLQNEMFLTDFSKKDKNEEDGDISLTQLITFILIDTILMEVPAR